MNNDLHYNGTVTVTDMETGNHAYDYYVNEYLLVRIDWCSEGEDATVYPNNDDVPEYILEDMASGTILGISGFSTDDILALLRWTEGEERYTNAILKLVEQL